MSNLNWSSLPMASNVLDMSWVHADRWGNWFKGRMSFQAFPAYLHCNLKMNSYLALGPTVIQFAYLEGSITNELSKWGELALEKSILKVACSFVDSHSSGLIFGEHLLNCSGFNSEPTYNSGNGAHKLLLGIIFIGFESKIYRH